MSLPDHLLDEPDSWYCDQHHYWHKGRVCPDCECDEEDTQEDWAIEKAQLDL